MIKLYIQGRKGEVEVQDTLTLNDVIDNISQIRLKFRNAGDVNWVNETFTVSVGSSFFKFAGGTTFQAGSVARSPGMDYSLVAEILEQSGKNRYTTAISVLVQDSNGKWEGKTFELIYVTQPKAEAAFTDVIPGSGDIKQSNIMKRNARYRGHRESEKVLSDHHEQILDIRDNFIDISNLTILQDISIESWFHGENGDPLENITYYDEKHLTAYDIQTTYALVPGVPASQFAGILIKLNGQDLTLGTHCIIDNGFLVLNSSALQNGSLDVSYTVTVSVSMQRMVGLYELREKTERLSERTNELEERMDRYENARK